jgi:transposase
MGRKSKYLEEYNEKLVAHLKEGYSYTSFASKVDVHIDTLYEWEKKYTEFSEAKKVGLNHSQAFWEDIGRKMALDGNVQAWKFNMKNRFGWREKEPETQKAPQEIKLAYKLKETSPTIIYVDEDDLNL